ncbi:MAG TPA: hypothetical protein VKH41_07375 [Myxococcota bacterium]|nr:hypothetical protein [Myxococcota bacterium]
MDIVKLARRGAVAPFTLSRPESLDPLGSAALGALALPGIAAVR